MRSDLEVLLGRVGLAEEAAEEGAERRDASAGGDHDVGLGHVVLGHEHHLHSLWSVTPPPRDTPHKHLAGKKQSKARQDNHGHIVVRHNV